MKHLLITLILSTFFCQFSFASKSYSLTVVVYSLWTTKPINGAKISYKQHKEIINAGFTDSTGTIILTGIKETDIDVLFSDPSGVHLNTTHFYFTDKYINDTLYVSLHLTKNNERVYFAKREQQYIGNKSLVIDQDSLVKLPQSVQDSLGFIPAKSLISKKEYLNFLFFNINYPQNCVENDIQGKVFVSFVVQPNGTITTVEIAKSVHPELDKEAQRIVNYYPNWSPATMNSVPVPVKVVSPISFKLN